MSAEMFEPWGVDDDLPRSMVVVSADASRHTVLTFDPRSGTYINLRSFADQAQALDALGAYVETGTIH